MIMRNRILKVYAAPLIVSKEVLLEKELTQSSIDISPLPPGASARIKVYDWDILADDDDLIISEPGNSSWE